MIRLHHHRNENLRRVAQFDPVKSFLRDADDRHIIAVDDDLFPDDLRVAGKVRLPVVVAQHDDRMPARSDIVVLI